MSTMAVVSPVGRPNAPEIQPQPESRRFGLTLNSNDFAQLGRALDRIGQAERAAEVASATLRIC